jgi:hypothetical protein
MKFDLITNLKTAKQIGVTMPPNMLARPRTAARGCPPSSSVARL